MYFTLEHDNIFKELGRLYVEDKLIAYTLDPRKLSNGLYTVNMTYSPKFATYLPHIFNDTFPLSRGFRIHAGNTLKDSNGCILVGNNIQIDLANKITLLNSKATLSKILSLLDKSDNKLMII